MEKLIKLNESCWHYKLIRFVWAFEPNEFKNLCPYFWLTIASLFVLPFILIWKGVLKCCNLICYPFIKLTEWIDEKSYQKQVLKFSETDLYFLKYRNEDSLLMRKAKRLKVFKLLDKFADKYPDKINKLLENFQDTLEVLHAFSNRVDQSYKQKEKKDKELSEFLRKQEEAKKKRKQRMNKIANATKSIFNSVLMLCIVVFIFAIVDTGLTDLIIYLSSFSINWVKVMCFLVAFIITSILVLIIILIIYLTEKWAKEEHKKWYYWTLLPIYYITGYLWEGIVIVTRFIWYNIIGGILIGIKEGFKEFGGIFAEYFNASYSDYCPGISWEEEKK